MCARVCVCVSTVIIKNYLDYSSIYPRPFILLAPLSSTFLSGKRNEYRRFREKLCKSPSPLYAGNYFVAFYSSHCACCFTSPRLLPPISLFFPLSSSSSAPFSLAIPSLHLPPFFPPISCHLQLPFSRFFVPSPGFSTGRPSENNREDRMIFPRRFIHAFTPSVDHVNDEETLGIEYAVGILSDKF